MDLNFKSVDPITEHNFEKQLPALVKHFKTVWETARKLSKNSQARNKPNYDKNARESKFCVSDKVRIRVENFRNRCRKLTPKWHGPFRILDLDEFNAVIVPLNAPFKEPKTVHQNCLKMDYTDNLPQIPIDSDIDELDDIGKDQHIPDTTEGHSDIENIPSIAHNVDQQNPSQNVQNSNQSEQLKPIKLRFKLHKNPKKSSVTALENEPNKAIKCVSKSSKILKILVLKPFMMILILRLKIHRTQSQNLQVEILLKFVKILQSTL